MDNLVGPLVEKLQALASDGDLSQEELVGQLGQLQNAAEMSVPQSEPLPGMELNDAGGYSFKVNAWKQLTRFLILGTETGTFYIKSQDLLNMNIASLVGLLKEGKGLEVVKFLQHISTSGRAPKDDPVLYCLAICANWEADKKVQKAAFEKMNIICNIPTKLFMFNQLCQRIVNRKRTSASFVPAPQLKRKRAANADPEGPPPAKKKVNTCNKRSSSWGRMRRKGVGAFYTDPKKDANKLLYLLTKYKSRHDWTHKQILGYTHPKMTGSEKVEKDLVITYCIRGFEAFQKMAENVVSNDSIDEIINSINVVEIVSNLTPAKPENKDILVNIYKQYGTSNFNPQNTFFPEGRKKKPFMLVREHVPNGFLRHAKLWEVMLQDMPMMAMLRNLGKMTALGLFDEGNDLNTAVVISKLTLVDMLQAARIHPIKILIAMRTYEAGQGIQAERPADINRRPKRNAPPPAADENKEEKAPNTWKANKQISKALDEAFYKTFKQPELKNGFKTGKKFMLALDVSGSMTMGGCIGCEALTPAVASCALSMITWNVEEDCEIYGFGGHLQNLKGSVLNKDMTVLDAMKATSKLSFGSTDCALPILEATKTKMHIDCFIVYTDSDTYVGRMHPCKALTEYRQKVNPTARLIVCAMQSNGFSIADPNDAGMLDIVGFDASVPEIISQFAKGEL